MSKAVLVISYNLPANVEEGHKRLQAIANKVRGDFENEPDVEIHVAIQESADAVLQIFEE